MATQKQIDLLRRPHRRVSARISMINEEQLVTDYFEGVTKEGSISIDAESVHRRSGNITLIVDESEKLLPSPSSSIWLNKRCSIHIGLEDYDKSIQWFNMGRFAIDSVDINVDAAEKTVKLELKDYMCFLDGTLGGELSHQISIPMGSATISHALRTVLSDLGRVSIDNIGVDGIQGIVPYDIEKPSGSTVYEIAKELVDLYKGYDFYFNADGYLVVEKIRDHRKSPIIETFIDDETDFTVSASTNVRFNNIRNSVWVWGDQADDGTQPSWVYRNRYSRESYSDLGNIKDAETGDICYIRNVQQSYRWSNLEYIGIAVSGINVAPVSPNSYSWSRYRGSGGIVNDDFYVHVKYSNDGGLTFTGNNGSDPGGWVGTYIDNIGVDSEKVSDYNWTKVDVSLLNLNEEGQPIRYVFVRYSDFANGGRFDGSDMRALPGRADWELLDFNVLEQFNIENVGEKTTVINESNILSEGQARLRAEYELKQRSNFAETVSLECVPLYHLDVNKKITVDKSGAIKGDFLITSLSIPLDTSSTMSVNARKLYE